MSVPLLLAVLSPFTGTVVRYRATYHPLSQPPDREHGHRIDSADSEHDIEANVVQDSTAIGEKSTVPAIPRDDQAAVEDTRARPTMTNTFLKVWRAEEFEGIFKGVFPAVFILFFSHFYVSPAPPGGLQLSGNHPGRYIDVLWNMLYLPFMIVAYRCITTPHKLATSHWKTNLSLILSPAELSPSRTSVLSRLPLFSSPPRIPFTHLFNPLLPTPFVPYLLSFIIITLSSHIAKWYIGEIGPLLDHFGDESPWHVFDHPRWAEWQKLGLHLVLAIVAALLGAPLDVVTTRLAVQRWEGEEEEARRVDGGMGRQLEKIGRADGLRLSCDEVKYRNALDCIRRIVTEEGWGTLYRVWWLTFLGCWWPFMR